MSALRLTPLMMGLLAFLLVADCAALAAYVAGWDRMIAMFGASGAAAARSPSGGWQPPVLDGDGGIRVKPYEAFAQTTARPLFSRTRRPFVLPAVALVQSPKDAAPPAPILAEPVITLSAIAIRGEARQALILTRAEPQGHWFSAGESIDGWNISSLGTDTLTLAAGSRTMTVNLFDQPAARGAAPPPPQPALR